MGTKKKQKMVLKYQYEDLPEEAKIEFREAYMTKSGMPYTTFYHKLRTDTFRPLEQNLFEKLLQELKQAPIMLEEYNENAITDEKISEVSEMLNSKYPLQ